MSITKYFFSAVAILLVILPAYLSAPPASLPIVGLRAAAPAIATEKKPEPQAASGQRLVQESGAFDRVVNPLNELVQQKYVILFSALQLSVQTREQLHDLLRARETIAGHSFYDMGSNSAEIVENLRLRELEVAEVDSHIMQLLTAEDAKKYTLLKDSTYEQALLNGFYQVAGMGAAPEPQKLNLLLGKLEQKQKIADLIASVNEQIASATPATKTFLIEKARREFVAEQERYLRDASTGLNDEQFELLRYYEQHLSDERWQDLISSWQ